LLAAYVPRQLGSQLGAAARAKLAGIERGQRNPSWGKLCDLADALHIPVTLIAEESAGARCPACEHVHGDTNAGVADADRI
jgi:transcriptional regulator with XRE-family HTH domain